MPTDTLTLNRKALSDQYRENRRRTRALFDVIRPEAYYARPIALRHPIVFYEGHLPAFIAQHAGEEGARAPGRRRPPRAPVRPRHRPGQRRRRRRQPAGRVAGARRGAAVRRGLRCPRPRGARQRSRRTARSSAAARGAGRLRDPRARGDAPGDAALHLAPAAVRRQARPGGFDADRRRRRTPRAERVAVPAGRATLGARRGEIPFGWDNEFPAWWSTCPRSPSTSTT